MVGPPRDRALPAVTKSVKQMRFYGNQILDQLIFISFGKCVETSVVLAVHVGIMPVGAQTSPVSFERRSQSETPTVSGALLFFVG